ncbi:MAG: hypothetical protein ABR552_08980 [Actinomycetota bacterium]|nr:hypothetical protein [Actinomycetota bacterium]
MCLGWAAATTLTPSAPRAAGAAYDAPYQYESGNVDFVAARFNEPLCSGAVPTDTVPVWTITDSGANTVLGTITVTNASSSLKENVVTFKVNDPAYPHGFAQGRADGLDGGAPFTYSLTAYPRKTNGVCDTTAGSTYTGTFALDRRVPNRPEITKPDILGRADNLPFMHNLRNGLGVDNFTMPSAPISGPVVVEGDASDPLTQPYDGDPVDRLETSGIKAVVVRLYEGQVSGFGPFIAGGTFLKSYTILNPDCSTPLDASLGYPAGMTYCSDTFHFVTPDIASDLNPGDWYGLDAIAIDGAGYRSPISSGAPYNNDNQQGPQSWATTFLYQG